MKKTGLYFIASIFVLAGFHFTTDAIAETDYPPQALRIARTYAQEHWGPVELYDAQTFYHLDDTPKLYVFVFSKNQASPPSKDELKSRISREYQSIKDIGKKIERIKSTDVDPVESQKQYDKLYSEIVQAKLQQQSKPQFCTIYCSVDDSKLNIVHAYSGLPSSFTQRPEIEDKIESESRLDTSTPSRVYSMDKFHTYYLASPGTPESVDEHTLLEPAKDNAVLMRMDAEEVIPLKAISDRSMEFISAPPHISAYSLNPPTPATVIITHGYQSGTRQPWIKEMAEAIRKDFMGGAKIYDFNRASGCFELQPDSSDTASRHAILMMDWAKLSNDMGKGYTEAAGDALFQALLYGQEQGEFSLSHLHFIGHSRGTVVNGEAVERLLYIGKPVIQVTTLDPHDHGALGQFSWTDDDVNPTLDKQGVVSWQGVQWADNLYQYDPGLPADFMLGLSGKSIPGTHEIYLGKNFGHSCVHEWYLGTIDSEYSPVGYTPVPFSDWYGKEGRPGRNEGGWNHARTLLNNGNPPVESGSKTPVQFRFNDTAQGLMNGDFRRNPIDIGDIEHPGWQYFGGEGTAHIDRGHLELDQGKEDCQRVHNYCYIPPEATEIQYDFKISNYDRFGMPKDKFRFLIDDVYFDGEIMDHTTSDYETRTFPLSESAKGTHKRITVCIDSNGSDVDSEVHIDNITFLIDDWPIPRYGQLTVSIYPAEIQSLAKWRITSGNDTNWKQHGQTIYGLPEGRYTVEFEDVPEWQDPNDNTISIIGKETVSATYKKLPGS